MNRRSPHHTNDTGPDNVWEARVQTTATAFTYPATPDIAGAVRRRLQAGPTRSAPGRRWLVWATVSLLIIIGGMLAVPQVRAVVVDFLQIGAIRIFLTQPTSTVTPPLTPIPPLTEVSPTTTSPSSSSLLQLAGATSLVEAQARVDFPIRLPGYPSDLGPPDRVFLQDLAGPVLVLVWLDADHPDQIRLSLHQLGPGTFAQKVEPLIVQETSVKGQPALWTQGPYLLQFERDGQVIVDTRRLVTGHVLIWVEKGITYRLETDLSLEEAVRIAESLK